jgi:hypothetical protein
MSLITREECEQDTKHPGKFEGAPPEARYFYECSLYGDGEVLRAIPEDGGFVALFEVTDADPAWVREAADGASTFELVEDTQGFVSGSWR